MRAIPVHTKGFSLIELIVVIVILGTLAVTALPRFVNLSDDATNAMIKSTAGALESGIKLAQASWYVKGQPSRADSVPGLSDSYSDDDVVFNENGFILDISDNRGTVGSSTVTQLSTERCGRIWNAILDHSPLLHNSGRGSRANFYTDDNGLFYFARNDNITNCYFALKSDNSKVITYNSVTGKVEYTL